MGEDSRKKRIQKKGLICIIAVTLLLVLLLFRIISRVGDQNKEQTVHREPMIEELRNVWIMGVGISEITLFCQGNTFTYKAQEEFLRKEYQDQVADVTLADGKITALTVKRDKLHGTLLGIGEEYVEVEGYGKLGLLRDYQGYRILDIPKMVTISDLVIGYDNADFVMEEGCVCAILLAREEKMDSIRVLLKDSAFETVFHQRLEITGDTQFTVVCGDRKKDYLPGEVISFAGGESSQEEMEGQEAGEIWTGAVGERARITPKALTGRITVGNLKRSQAVPTYRGELEICFTQDGLVVINQLPLEEYLYSVVPSEMPASYPPEALKAQAICARTYAYGKLLRAGYPQYGAHVDDSTSYQVYNNVTELQATTQAVKDTYGELLFAPDGACAQTYYYSTSCGVGTDASVWQTSAGTAPEYLKSKRISRAADIPIPEDPQFLLQEDPLDYEYETGWYRWSYTVSDIDEEMFCSKLQTLTGEKLSFRNVYGLTITRRGPGGIATELTISTEMGDIIVKGESAIRQALCDGTSKAIGKDGKEKNCSSLLPSAFFLLTTSHEKENVLGYSLVGGGYGHGIGMSQNGACEMAKDGMNAEEILAFFYEGCQLKKLY